MALVTLTATTPGPCACCGVGGATMYCRTRGGSASLVGCSEIVSPSVPPKKYRRTQSAGSSQTDSWPNPSCAGASTGTVICVYTGFIQYDRVTGLPTTGGATTCNGVPQPGGACAAQGVDSCSSTWTNTPTSNARTCSGNCCPDGLGNSFKCITDSLTNTLSDEDTEDDAIARLLAGGGGTWSAYSQVGDGSGGTCVAPSCCLASYAQRTTGFSFGYQESQFKLVMTLLDPSTNYVVTVQVYRRLQGSSDPWVLLLDSPFGFTTDGSGNYTITDQDVPNLEGYETYACCPFVYKP